MRCNKQYCECNGWRCAIRCTTNERTHHGRMHVIHLFPINCRFIFDLIDFYCARTVAMCVGSYAAGQWASISRCSSQWIVVLCRCSETMCIHIVYITIVNVGFRDFRKSLSKILLHASCRAHVQMFCTVCTEGDKERRQWWRYIALPMNRNNMLFANGTHRILMFRWFLLVCELCTRCV